MISKRINVYTDLKNRTRSYTIPKNVLDSIEKEFNIKFIDKLDNSVEIYWGDKVSNNKIKNLNNLKWIHLSKTGFDIVKFNNIKNITITNTPKSSEGVAEFALSCILFFARRLNKISIYRNDNNKLNRSNFDDDSIEIKPFNKTYCLIFGYGNIGKRLESLLKSIDMNVDIIDKDNFNNRENLVDGYNFIINTLPLNNSTKNCFNKNLFNKMSQYTYFINIGRGESVDEEALYDGIKNKQLKGAFLDVIKDEPIKIDNKLLTLKNIFISPHIANAMYNNIETQVNAFRGNLIRYLNNKKLKDIVYE